MTSKTMTIVARRRAAGGLGNRRANAPAPVRKRVVGRGIANKGVVQALACFARQPEFALRSPWGRHPSSCPANLGDNRRAGALSTRCYWEDLTKGNV